MSDTKVQTIQDIYERFGRGDFNAILERVIDDVDWASEPALPRPLARRAPRQGRPAQPLQVPG